MTPWIMLLTTLAVFRVSLMVTREEGPFAIFASIRERVDPSQQTWLGRGLNCIQCVSFWLSLVAVLLLGGNVLEWLAIASGVIIVNKVIMR